MAVLVDVRDFDFDLPAELIAQRPPEVRGQSRLLVLPRHAGPVEHSTFARLPEHLQPGDLLVVNDTRVFPARLLGRRVPSGGAVECLLLRQLSERDSGFGIRDSKRESRVPGAELTMPNPEPRVTNPESRVPNPEPRVPNPEPRVPNPELWDALMHPGQKLKPGARVVFEGNGERLHGEIVAQHFYGRRTIRLWSEGASTVAKVIDRIGHVPLPPYIDRGDEPVDRERYQTVFAHDSGSVAAPTAGLHFTPALLEELRSRGVERTAITLHVGYGTFKPVRVERVEEHEVDPERFSVTASAADALTRALREGRRVIAVGTTTTRALESLLVDSSGAVAPTSGTTRLFIHPGHTFRIVRGLITNFHLPRSSLLMLVCAFSSRERVLEACGEAVERKYRFYSYGDAMLIL